MLVGASSICGIRLPTVGGEKVGIHLQGKSPGSYSAYEVCKQPAAFRPLLERRQVKRPCRYDGGRGYNHHVDLKAVIEAMRRESNPLRDSEG